MTPLEWDWTLRFGPYARATFASQPAVLVVPVAGGVLLALLLHHGLGAVGTVVVALVFAVVLLGLLTVSVATGLRRLRRATGSTVQRYALTDDAVEIALGDDRQSLPRAELSVVRTGAGWIALRRRAMTGRRLLLLFDDPALAPEVLARLRPSGSHR